MSTYKTVMAMHVHKVKIVSGSMFLAVTFFVIKKTESYQKDHDPNKDC